MDKAALVAALGALASKAVDFLKRLTNKDWNGAVTLAIVWIAGVAATALGAASQVFKGVPIPGTGVTFDALDGPSTIFFGMSLSSFLAVVYDYKAAIDGSDSAKQPPLTKLPDGDPPTP